MSSSEEETKNLSTAASVQQSPQNSPNPSSGNELVLAQLLTAVKSLDERMSQLCSQNTSLQSCVSQLQNENIILRNDFTTLQNNSGVMFLKFTKLPPELRRYIWQLACRIPQIHIITDKHVSQSRIASVMNCCREARGAALSLQLDYFLLSIWCHWWNGDYKVGKTKVYFNHDLDTFWFVSCFDGSYCLFNGNLVDTEWFCGQCDNSSSREGRKRGAQCHTKILSPDDPGNLRSVAINIDNWALPGHGNGDTVLGSLDFLIRVKVDKILIVVDSYGLPGCEVERDVMFVSPARRPYPTLRLGERSGLGEKIQFMPDCSWQDVEILMVQFMQGLKDERAADRKQVLDSGEVSIEAMNSDPALEDLSNWKIPEVRFVEARKRNGPWVLLPEDNGY